MRPAMNLKFGRWVSAEGGSSGSSEAGVAMEVEMPVVSEVNEALVEAVAGYEG